MNSSLKGHVAKNACRIASVCLAVVSIVFAIFNIVLEPGSPSVGILNTYESFGWGAAFSMAQTVPSVILLIGLLIDSGERKGVFSLLALSLCVVNYFGLALINSDGLLDVSSNVLSLLSLPSFNMCALMLVTSVVVLFVERDYSSVLLFVGGATSAYALFRMFMGLTPFAWGENEPCLSITLYYIALWMSAAFSIGSARSYSSERGLSGLVRMKVKDAPSLSIIDAADLIKQYNDLLQMGAISKEEYLEKKAEILFPEAHNEDIPLASHRQNDTSIVADDSLVEEEDCSRLPQPQPLGPLKKIAAMPDWKLAVVIAAGLVALISAFGLFAPPVMNRVLASETQEQLNSYLSVIGLDEDDVEDALNTHSPRLFEVDLELMGRDGTLDYGFGWNDEVGELRWITSCYDDEYPQDFLNKLEALFGSKAKQYDSDTYGWENTENGYPVVTQLDDDCDLWVVWCGSFSDFEAWTED